MLPMIRLLTLIALILSLTAPVDLSADDKAVTEKAAAMDQTIAQLKASEADAEAKLVDLRTQLQTQQQQKLRWERQSQNAAEKLAELNQQKPEKEAAAAKAQLARAAAREQLAAAEKAAAALKDKSDATDEQKQQAEQKLAEVRKQVDAAQQALAAPTQELLTLLAGAATHQQTVDRAKAEIENIAPQIEATQHALANQEAVVTQAAAKRLEQERALQQMLVDAGRWVSFTDEIAPIFHHRCVACHNARTAKGRLNLESYANLVAGGESGEAFTPGAPADSLLCLVVEDGSMPQDADPLTAEQIATLSKWVEFGGRLDAGVNPGDRLIEIMPRRPQPAPPEHYSVPLAVTALAFSPDGATLATSGYHEVLLWNVADGTLKQRIQNVAETVHDLAFHPDAQRLAVTAGTPGQAGEVKLFRLDGGELLADLVRTEDAVLGVAFSPDGSKLAACGADRAIRIFDASTSELLTTIEDHADWVLSIAFSPDGTKLASASRDKTSKVFDAATGDALGTFNGHAEIVYGVGFSADGKQAITCGADKLVRVWNVADSKETRKIGGAASDLLTLALLPDGRVVSGGSDKLARIQQTKDGKTLVTLAEHPDWIYAVDLHAPTGLVATGCADGVVRLWKLDGGEAIREWPARP